TTICRVLLEPQSDDGFVADPQYHLSSAIGERRILRDDRIVAPDLQFHIAGRSLHRHVAKDDVPRPTEFSIHVRAEHERDLDRSGVSLEHETHLIAFRRTSKTSRSFVCEHRYAVDRLQNVTFLDAGLLCRTSRGDRKHLRKASI